MQITPSHSIKHRKAHCEKRITGIIRSLIFDILCSLVFLIPMLAVPLGLVKD